MSDFRSIVGVRSHRLAASMALLAGAIVFAGCGGGGSGSTAPTAQTLTASFTFTNASGPRPLDVQFTNSSSGNPTTFAWDFGDGSTSIERDPSHRYETPGTFTVRLEASGALGVDDFVATNAIRVTAPLTDASFESQLAGSAPNGAFVPFYGAGAASGILVRSAATGADGPMPSDGSLWCEIGADSTSTTLPPSEGAGSTPRTGAGFAVEFTFPQGRSVIQLDALFLSAEPFAATARNDWMSIDLSNGAWTKNVFRRDTFAGFGSASDIHVDLLTTPLERVTADLAELFVGSDVTTPFVLTVQVGNGGDGTAPSRGYVDAVRFELPGASVGVNFTGAPTLVEAGLPVQFVQLSSGGPTTFSWDFGDGTASSFAAPAHVYANPGVYDVTLRAAADSAAGVLVRPDYVTVFAPSGDVDFSASPNPAATGTALTFTNLSNGPFVEFTWSFGDGGSLVQPAGSPTAVHTYTSAGNYSVRLTGRFANQTTVSQFKPDYARVQDSPAIQTQPQGQTVVLGQPATFQVTATGTALHYEWLRLGVVVPGAPDLPTYTTHPTTAADDGVRYGVRVFNEVGSVQSNSATLDLVTAPVVTIPPQAATVGAGMPATFNVIASGIGLSYQWQRNTVPIPGAPNSPSYTTPNTTLADNGAVYRVRVSNAAGSTTSNGAILTVIGPPAITQHPASLSVNAGQNAQFTVTATGTGLAFEWQRNGVTIPGAPNAPTYVLANVTGPDNAAIFRVRATNLGGSVTSNPATLTVFTTPAITQHPANTTVNVGQAATFQVTATGGGLAYQWQRNGVAIPGAPSAASYTTGATVAGDNGATYRVRVSNAAGFVVSNEATLTVTNAPVITVDPVDVNVAAGTSATFLVVATGTGLSYRWEVDLAGVPVAYVPIPGAMATSVQVITAASDNGNRYRCVVTNTAGSDTSSGALLTVVSQPVITQNPANAAVNVGRPASFTIAATGGGLSYAWLRNGAVIAGAPNSPSYTIGATVAGDHDAHFSCRVTNLAGNATSTEATLTVYAVPVITQSPANQTVNVGQTATFSVIATGVGLAYQWQKNSVAIPGAPNAPMYTTAATVAGDNGSTYRVRVSNPAGNLFSSSATLSVVASPVITGQPTDRIVAAGSSVSFMVTATGLNLTYQWFRDLPTAGDDFTLVGGATSAMYGFTAGAGDNGNRYRCTVTNSAGFMTSSAASLTVVVAPVITLNPVSVQVNVGQAASFTVAATGGGLTYQWRRNGSPIQGAPNSPTYPITATVAGDHGAQFACRVFNLANEATSTAALLTVVTAPSITQNPSNVSVVAGQTATFQIQASGLNLAYQWQVDLPTAGDAFNPIQGETASSYSFTAASGDDGKRYRCSVSNTVGTIPSSAALLTVVFAPSITQNPSNQTVTAPTAATFQVAAIGGSLSYQWRFATAAAPSSYGNVNGATSAMLSLNPTNTTQTGNRYLCRVTNAAGTIDSSFATLTVNGPPTFTLNPSDQTILVNQSATFQALAVGPGPITYQWRRRANSTSIWLTMDGATSSQLIWSNVNSQTEPGFNGHQFSCVASNSFGPTPSSTATLSLTLEFDRLYTTFGTFGTCTACHSAAGQATNGNLNLGTVATALFDLKTEALPVTSCVPNGRRVQPFSATNSQLYKRVSGTTCGSQMGTGSFGTLEALQRNRIQFWIDQGAAD